MGGGYVGWPRKALGAGSARTGGSPVAAAFDLLDAQVAAVGGPVGSAGAVVFEDLGPPSGQGPAPRTDLFDVVVGAAGDGLVHEQLGFARVVGR